MFTVHNEACFVVEGRGAQMLIASNTFRIVWIATNTRTLAVIEAALGEVAERD